MAAPKTARQMEANDVARLITRCRREFEKYMGEYIQKHKELPQWAAELLRNKAFDHVAMLTRVGMMALLPMDKSKPQLTTATVALGTAAKYTHVELTRPEQATNIGQVFVMVKQFSEGKKKLEIEPPRSVEAEVVSPKD